MIRQSILAVLLFAIPAAGQILHPTTPLPGFEVATIKPWQSPPPPPPGEHIVTEKVMYFGPASTGQISDRVHFIGQIEILLANAFHMPISAESRIVNAPDWVRQESARYELNAKIDDTLFAAMQAMPAAQQRDQIALMEQALLVDRLKLKFHFETRELPRYALVVAKGGAKLSSAKPGEATRLSSVSNQQGTVTTGTAITLEELVRSPLLFGQRLVVDQTNLKGAFDFTLRWTPDQQALNADTPTDAPTLLTALQEQLGLRLMPTKGPVEVLVIDHIEPPTLN